MTHLTPPTEAERIEAITRGDMPFEWYRCDSVDAMRSFYLSRLPAIRDAARKHGYAIGLHGSELRDFDLIAVPWVKECSDREVLVRAIHRAACGIESDAYKWEEKPHGRSAASFPVCWTEWHDMVSAGHIDLSVIAADPLTAYAKAQQAEIERLRQAAEGQLVVVNTAIEKMTEQQALTKRLCQLLKCAGHKFLTVPHPLPGRNPVIINIDDFVSRLEANP